ncbi:DUF4162 domain-containing protein, partial [Streptococcus hyovaginalis]
SKDVPRERLENLPHVRSISETKANTWRLVLDDEAAGPELFQLISGGHYLATFNQQAPTIDEIFKMKAEVTE